MKSRTHQSTQKKYDLKAHELHSNVNEISVTKLRTNDYIKKEIRKKVYKYKENQFTIVLKHPNIVELTDIEFIKTRHIILNCRKCDSIALPIIAESYEQAYSFANDIVALIQKGER